MTKTPEAVAQGKMRPRPGAPPGLETDGKGNVIPLAQRTEEDQQAAMAADPSIKDPDGEAENPSPMPREQQGKGGRGVDHDPEGQQGGQPVR